MVVGSLRADLRRRIAGAGIPAQEAPERAERDGGTPRLIVFVAHSWKGGGAWPSAREVSLPPPSGGMDDAGVTGGWGWHRCLCLVPRESAVRHIPQPPSLSQPEV